MDTTVEIINEDYWHCEWMYANDVDFFYCVWFASKTLTRVFAVANKEEEKKKGWGMNKKKS